MKTNKIILTFIFVLANLLTFSQLKVNSTGKVGVNNSSPTYQLDVNGNMRFQQGGSSSIIFENGILFTSTYASIGKSDGWWNKLYVYSPYFYNYPIYGSDIKLKKEIKDLDNSIEKLTMLRPVSYKMLTKKEFTERDSNLVFSDEGIVQMGFIAQEVQEIFPEIVAQLDNETLGIKYTEFIPLLVKGFQEQQTQIEELKSQLENCCKSSLKSASITTGTTTDLTENKAQLDQNIPNPFSRETRIGCFIPDESGTSMLYIYNMNGTQLQQYSITNAGKQTVTINGNSLQPGMYLYALVIDGKEVDTKRMILTK